MKAPSHPELPPRYELFVDVDCFYFRTPDEEWSEAFLNPQRAVDRAWAHYVGERAFKPHVPEPRVAMSCCMAISVVSWPPAQS